MSHILFFPKRFRNYALESTDNLPPPDVLAREIIEDLAAALEQFRAVAGNVNGEEEEIEASV